MKHASVNGYVCMNLTRLFNVASFVIFILFVLLGLLAHLFTTARKLPGSSYSFQVITTYDCHRLSFCSLELTVTSHPPSHLGTAASPPLTAENGLARCVC